MYLEHFIMYVTLGTAGIPCIQANIILCEYIYRFGADSIYSIYRYFKKKETLKEDTHKSINDSEGINMEEGNPEEISDDLDTSVTPEFTEASENVSNSDKEL
jgi:glucan biosynthesis protein